MQPQNSTGTRVEVDAEDLFAMLYRVPMYARDGAFRRLTESLPSFDPGREQCLECDGFRSIDLLCECEQGMEPAR
jgi:hypothetical protein